MLRAQALPISDGDHPKPSTPTLHTPHEDDNLHATIGVLASCLYLYPTLKTLDANESVMQPIPRRALPRPHPGFPSPSTYGHEAISSRSQSIQAMNGQCHEAIHRDPGILSSGCVARAPLRLKNSFLAFIRTMRRSTAGERRSGVVGMVVWCSLEDYYVYLDGPASPASSSFPSFVSIYLAGSSSSSPLSCSISCLEAWNLFSNLTFDIPLSWVF